MTSALIWLRSWIYLIAFLTWTLSASIVCLPVLLSQSWTLSATRMWIRGIMALARVILHIDCRVLGRENVPEGACIIAAQHQSSFETFRLFMDLKHPVFILKRELIWIPLIGWYMLRIGFVSIDRSAGGAAIRKMLRGAQAALDAGNQVIVFPEGTRVAPGESRPYRPGIAALYAYCTAPVIPLALNSGHSWGKTRVLKLPGQITLKFLPALAEGLSKDAVLTELRAGLDAAGATLAAPTPQGRHRP